MQYFCHNYIKKRYSDKVKLLLVDTDSVMYKFEVWNDYEDFYKEKEVFGFIMNLKKKKALTKLLLMMN